jgi:hypothetical protein
MEPKNLPIRVEIPSEIKELARRIEQWRNRRDRSRRMPDSLWAIAAQLARHHGVHRVARCLRLDYYSLKERVNGSAGAIEAEPRPTFIELPALNSVPECAIELEHPGGTRMRIHVKGTALPDVAELTRAFCGAKR